MRRLAPALVSALALALAVPATASAIQVLIVSGPGRGVVLDVDEQTSAVNDPELGAVGVIAAAFIPDCDSIHYHGTLFNKPDPDANGCGWGKVSPVQNHSDSVQNLGDAISFEFVALEALKRGEEGEARDNLASARGSLEQAGDRLGQLYRPGSRAKGKTSSKLDKADKLDAKAQGALDDGKIKRARRLIKKAIKIKRKQLKKLLKRENELRAPR